MRALLDNLGIDWKMLIAQAVNFGLLLVVLRIFAYQPLLTLMRKRRARIEEGLMKADEADRRLGQANEMAKAKVREAEAEGLSLLRKTEEDAKALEARLMGKAHEKEAAMMKEAGMKAKAKEKEAEEQFRREAANLVRQAIVRTVEMKPDAIDDALVERAVAEVVKRRA